MRLAAALLLVAACGSSGNKSVDAAATADAKVVADARVVDATPADAAPDAKPSTVVPISCTGITPDVTVTVVSTPAFAFSPATSTITANQVVRFMTGSFHPVASGTGGVPDGNFSTSGDGCFRFTAAGTFPFYCTVHLFTGSITVQ